MALSDLHITKNAFEDTDKFKNRLEHTILHEAFHHETGETMDAYLDIEEEYKGPYFTKVGVGFSIEFRSCWPNTDTKINNADTWSHMILDK